MGTDRYIGATGMRLASIADIASAVRGRRQELGLSQGDLAARAGVSRKWLNQFEAGGRASAELGLVLRVLDAAGLTMHAEPRGEPSRDGGDVDGVNLDMLLDDLRRG